MFVTGAGLATIPSWAMGSRYEKLTILHTNDIHCHIDPFDSNDPAYPNMGGLNRVAACVKRFRMQDPNLLLFDSGDFSQGTSYFNYYKSDLILKLMSEMGYDASCIGNHEFDNGLQALADAISGAKFPILSSNYNFEGTPVAPVIKENLIIERAGFRIGVYSLGIDPDGLVDPKSLENVVYLNSIEVAQKQEEYLRYGQDCDLVICLSHLGYSYKDEKKLSEIEIAKNTTNTDIILGGHTHTFFEKPIEVTNKNGRKVILNQAGWGALMLGRLDLVFERRRKFDNVSESNFEVK